MNEYNVSEQTRRRNGFTEDLVEFISLELCARFNIEKKEAIKVAEEITLALHENWRGLSIVFPMRPQLFMDRQRQKALAEFDGTNITYIVKRYGIAENTFYVWLKEENQKLKEQRDANQGHLDL